MKTNRGMALVEIVIGSAILSVVMLASSEAYGKYVDYAFSNQKNIQASYLIEEELEGVSFLRDKGWTANISKLSTTTTYYLTWNSSYWATTTSAQYVDGQFLRSFAITDVKRDGSDKIASSGTYDANTKKITATVSYWQGRATTTRSVSTYITNIYSN